MSFRSFAFLAVMPLIVFGFNLEASRTVAATAEAKKASPGAVAAEPAPAVPAPPPGMHRYMVVRTFPAGALDGLDAAGKRQVNKANADQSVRWVQSFANPDRTRTFCIYEGPNEKAIRAAAAANKLPVDEVVEIPLVLKAQ